MARTFDSPRYGTLREFLVKNAGRRAYAMVLAKWKPMKKPKPKARTAAIRVRMKPSVKAMAEQLARKDARSLADWLERLIAAEAVRRAGKK
jgi:hypothetical protein